VGQKVPRRGDRSRVSYVRWLKEDLPADRRLPEDARDLLERHLDPDVERTVAIHSLYGKWFPYLATADPTWNCRTPCRDLPRRGRTPPPGRLPLLSLLQQCLGNAFRLLIDA